MQFSAVLNIFIVKTKLNSTFTNDLKKNKFFRKLFIVTEYAALNVLANIPTGPLPFSVRLLSN